MERPDFLEDLDKALQILAFARPAPILGRFYDGQTGRVVSTVHANEGWYETAILNEWGAWPVETYKTRDEAVRGHYKWLQQVSGLKRIEVVSYELFPDDVPREDVEL